MDAILILLVVLSSLAGIGAAAGSFGSDSRHYARTEDDLSELDIESYRADRNR